MNILTRQEYENIMKGLAINANIRKCDIDVYHKNNWNGFDNYSGKSTMPSYIDFFFDSKTMVDFFKKFIAGKQFTACYLATAYHEKYKLKHIDNPICEDVFNEFRKMLHSLGLRITTYDAIRMNKQEFLNWCDRFSIGGFCGVSDYTVLIPELKLSVKPHHHMNYLFYTGDKKNLLTDLLKYKNAEVLMEY